jgi:hypothetical protein
MTWNYQSWTNVLWTLTMRLMSADLLIARINLTLRRDKARYFFKKEVT